MTSVKLIKADSRHALLLKLEMCLVSKSLLDSVDFTRYVDPDLFDLGPLTQYFCEMVKRKSCLQRLLYSCLKW